MYINLSYNTHYIRIIIDIINQINLGNNFVRPIEPINKLINLGLNTLCRGYSSYTTFVGLLYPRGDKSEKVYTDYKV